MPPRWLTDELIFPPPESATRDGLVAIGGDARPERLVLAYAQGIFPWPSPGAPLLWFSPNPRFVLRPREAYLGRSLRKRVRRGDLEVRFDTAFRAVMEACAETPRPGQDGTWITPELRLEVSCPIPLPRSRTSTSRPASASARAIARPTTPAPITTASAR